MQSHSKFIGHVPRHLIQQAVPKKVGRGWRADFNVAVWLHLALADELQVTLKVSYQDGETVREQLIDRGRPGFNQRILLCGIARLEYNQAIESMSLSLLSDEPIQTLMVGELFVQAVELQRDGERSRKRR
ncbi:hypothetical protein SAMN05216189_100859 [Pseudomonas delhiensis]|uniref:Uncharacterized protein n=2 Tax=Pseudomonas delhiensis TaxID=366289 RepID=A0A239FSD7_9PSED|nr:hypothetical protein SAMN05216189_100859 [Pseudomonas delhiensis]SNS59841.1 hypothetical protein SAMN06295949_10459 [Pseudomonas delhiensis]